MAVGEALLLYVLLLLSCLAQGEYTPLYGKGHEASYTDGPSNRFPDMSPIVSSQYQYFISELNFEDVSDKILTGAADKLYLLTPELQEIAVYEWTTDNTHFTACNASDDNPEYACRNHIRVYKKMPTNPDKLFVCGTQAAEQSQCRTVNITLQNPSSTAVASDGIVSYYPDFNGFGDFRNDGSSDSVYFTAGLFDGPDGVGRHFSISYQSVDVGGSDNLTTTELFRTINANNYWLRFPVVFVDYYKADYSVVAPASASDDYQFYFVFLRENLYDEMNAFDIVYSRVVRICRNDMGSSGAGGMDKHFTTFMKARIYCQLKLPTGREFAGAIDYQYNEITSMAFNDDGRFYEDGTWVKMMYGAFSGPKIGPTGSAICVYRADNSFQTGGTGENKGIFDIFREDLLQDRDDPLPDLEVQNFWTECGATRTDTQAQNEVIIVPDIEQIKINGRTDPLLILDDTFVTQMILDRVCVVRSTNPAVCRNQDVLFLGTDTGKILKVVMGTDFGPEIVPVIAEEISLDDDNAINEMKLETVEGTKYLYVSTWSKIYRMPLERCSRHQSCNACIGSRDPYCIWNSANLACELSDLSANADSDGVVADNIHQDIHTGEVSICASVPECVVNASALDYGTIQVQIECNDTDKVKIGVPVLGVSDVSLDLTNGKGSDSFPGSHGLQTVNITVTADDGAGPVFTARVTTPPGPPLALKDSEVYADSVSSTSVRVTVSIDTFTDDFNNYRFQVFYNSDSTSYQYLNDSNSIEISGLSPDETITYYIMLTNSIGASRSLNDFSVTLRDGIAGPPQNLLVSALTATSLTLTWDEPAQTNGEIDGYFVQISENSFEENVTITPASNEYTFEGLTPYTEYTVNVQAYNDAGEGTANTTTGTTECGVSGQVQNLALTSMSSSELCYSWTDPIELNGDNATKQYKVIRECWDPVTGLATTTDNDSPMSVCVPDLKPLTHCCVTVSTTNMCSSQPPIEGLPIQLCSRTSDVVPGDIRGLTIEALSPFGLLAIWEPPENYQRSGLTYNIRVEDTTPTLIATDSVTDLTSYYIGNLTANTLYSIAITAESGEGVGNPVTMNGSTLPSAPAPPTNPTLSIIGPLELMLTWDDATAADFSVSEYRAVWRCNELDNGTSTPGMSITIDISDPGADFAWCTAQVQAINNIGQSDYSELADIAIPSRIPSQPRCFLNDDFGSTITVSFDVTYPFSLGSLTVNYTLISDLGLIRMPEVQFDANSSNVFYVDVSRNTRYSFELSVCNRFGCSPPCQDLLNFTTSTVSPRPPADVNASDITCCSANITWELPQFEDEATTEYTIELSSSQEMRIIRSLQQRWYSFGNLYSETDYTVAVKVTDTNSNITGLYGPAHSFQTRSGIPTEPREVSLDYNDETKSLEVYWLAPATRNGTITRYEIQWSGSSNMNCDEPNGVVYDYNEFDTTKRDYKTDNTSNVESSNVILVCVRARTQDEVGQWGSDFKDDVNTKPLSIGSSDECDGLYIVAGVTSFAIISTIVMIILLMCVVARNCKPFERCLQNYTKEDKEAQSYIDSGSSNGTLETPTEPPPLMSQFSKEPLVGKHATGSDSGLSGDSLPDMNGKTDHSKRPYF